MEECKINLDEEILEAVLERPYGFSVNETRMYLYPVSLGKSILLSRLMLELGIDADLLSKNPSIESLRVVSAHRDTACHIVAYCTANGKQEVFDADFIAERKWFLSINLADDELAQLLLIIYQYDKTAVFLKHLGLDRDLKEQAKISKLKNKGGNTLVFGGKSIYGSLISVACEKYGWTLDYVVWGISLVNLRMMLADSVNSVYLSDDEKKSAKVTVGQEVVNMDNPDNWAKIKSMKWD